MEKVESHHLCSCPSHPSLPIKMINLDKRAEKELYCSGCIEELEASKNLPTTLQAFDKFLSTAAQVYSQTKPHSGSSAHVPEEYLNILTKQGEDLGRFTSHIQHEKDKVQRLFDELTKDILEVLQEKRNEYLGLLDHQLEILKKHYTSFQKKVRKTYLKSEDIDYFYPSKEELDHRLAKLHSFSELSEFVREVKEDLNNVRDKENSQPCHESSKYLALLAKFLGNIDACKPHLDEKDLDLTGISASVKRDLDDLLHKELVPKDLIQESTKIYPESNMLSNQDFEVIQGWIPEKYQFSPKLIYKSSRDGGTFHAKCDNKGPTITVIKCQFDGSTTNSVIGGFLGQSWHKKGGYITSKDAFVFSLTTNAKCEILSPECAAYGGSTWAVNFGGGAINVTENLKQSYCCYSQNYANFDKIVDVKGFKHGTIHFKIKDIEVYSLK